jgi:hypothetical protein
LIYPDSDHEGLVVDEANLAKLMSIKEPIAVVSGTIVTIFVVTIAVVGPLHSGKSYLANQLMNRTKGFEIGPTVLPKTSVWNL